MRIVNDCLVNVLQRGKGAYQLEHVHPTLLLLLVLLPKLQMREVFAFGRRPIAEN